MPAEPSFVAIGPLRILRTTGEGARARLVAALDETGPLCVAFCNAHTAQLAFDRPGYAATLSDMLLLNDGIGLDLAARALGYGPFPENLNGTDFVPGFLRECRRPLRIFTLGARREIAERAAAVLAQRFPQHAVVGVQHGFFADADLPDIVAAIVASGADLVLCAMGNPRQEEMMAALARRGAGRVLIGVGALFDFLADAVPRAPPWVRQMRMEFLYRLAQEPRRLGRRYTVEIALFLLAVARLRRTARRRSTARAEPAE